jgi:hypothetical protein
MTAPVDEISKAERLYNLCELRDGNRVAADLGLRKYGA